MVAEVSRRDYSLVGKDAEMAVEQGLASAEWYACPIERKKLKELMKRKDGPAIRDTLLWFFLLALFGGIGIYFWGKNWFISIPAFLIYGVFYCSASDSRWHECGHRTAFKTTWMNDVVYNMASFMVCREPTPWRWSHTRHHSDTIIVGRDPEIAVPRPPDIKGILLNFFALTSAPAEMKKVIQHSLGRILPAEATYIPDEEYPKVFRAARIWMAIHLGTIALAIYMKSFLPLMVVGLVPTMYGQWLLVVFGLTQHAGLAEDVLDHRLNCRTVYMNPIFRYIYWNMNYHLEHHMFPMVPYYNLKALHEEIKHDTPKPYNGIIEAYREIIPALLKQVKDPYYYVKRELPDSAKELPPSHSERRVAPAGN